MADHNDDTAGHRVSRRDFLKRTAGAAGAAGAASLVAGGLDRALAGSQKQADRTRLVVQARSEYVVTTRGVHEEVLADLLDIFLVRLTGQKSPRNAWGSILKPDDTIALKFNRSGADGLATTDSMMRVLVRSLTDTGFDASKIVAVEVSPAIRAETGTQAPSAAWSVEQYDFKSGKDHLAAWLEDVTAIINVPFLKTHNIAGMTCCLKNLSHALVKHPAQYHKNGCSPYIGDIVALPQIREKLRLNLVNALRAVFDRGPEAREEDIWAPGTLLGGFDPVAVDAMGLQKLDLTRRSLGLSGISAVDGTLPYLEASSKRGIGLSKPHQINLVKVKL